MRDARHSIERIKEVFFTFLVLGLTSFGGPIAHLGYFRAEFVTRRRWLSEADYADLVALCQFLPGPASSQVGFALGLLRGGGWGAVAAWTAFTLPSALVLVLFASGAASFDGPVSEGILHGLKVAAVAIVAHAVWGMAHKLCPDQRRAGIALAAVLIVVLIGGPAGMIAAILAGAVGGMLLCRDSAYRDQVRRDQGDPVSRDLHFPVSRRAARIAAVCFITLLIGLPGLAWVSSSPVLSVADAFYRAAARRSLGAHHDLPTGARIAGGRAALLERFQASGTRAVIDARRECRRGGHFGGRSLPTGLDQCDCRLFRVCLGIDGLFALERLEIASLGGRGHPGARGDRHYAVVSV